MNYYSFHIGDYRRDTSHLSLLEHGVYRQLLDWIYLDEKPIPKETDVVFRRLCARTDEEKGAVIIVLKELFELAENGYIQTRCMGEIAAYQGQAARARENGKLGGRPPKTTVVISGLSEKTEIKANQEPITNNQEPLPKEEKALVASDAGRPDCPHEKIVALYHEHLPVLPSVKTWNEGRRKLLATRWREDEKRQNLEFWERFFKYVAKIPFLLGENDRGWQADLEWMLNIKKFTKIIEGGYERKQT